MFCVLYCCFIIIVFSLSSSFSSLTCFHLIASRKKLFVWRENSILPSRLYSFITARVRHAHIDVVFNESFSFVMTLCSLIFSCMKPIVLIVLNDQLNTTIRANDSFLKRSLLFILTTTLLFVGLDDNYNID